MTIRYYWKKVASYSLGRGYLSLVLYYIIFLAWIPCHSYLYLAIIYPAMISTFASVSDEFYHARMKAHKLLGIVWLILGFLGSWLRSLNDLALENLALHQQLASQHLALDGQAPALVVVKKDPLFPEFLFEDLIFCDQVVYSVHLTILALTLIQTLYKSHAISHSTHLNLGVEVASCVSSRKPRAPSPTRSPTTEY